jgi:hypothetical protein
VECLCFYRGGLRISGFESYPPIAPSAGLSSNVSFSTWVHFDIRTLVDRFVGVNTRRLERAGSYINLLNSQELGLPPSVQSIRRHSCLR